MCACVYLYDCLRVTARVCTRAQVSVRQRECVVNKCNYKICAHWKTHTNLWACVNVCVLRTDEVENMCGSEVRAFLVNSSQLCLKHTNVNMFTKEFIFECRLQKRMGDTGKRRERERGKEMRET